MPLTIRALPLLLLLCASMLVATACSSSSGVDIGELAAPDPTMPEPTDEPAPRTQPEPSAPQITPAPLEPEAHVPAGPVGSAHAYDAMVQELEQHVPIDLRDEVPWPDLRNPDPVVAQLQIFDLWVWMAATLPEPRLVEAIAAEGSPSRQEIVGIFGQRQAARELVVRTSEPYVAFDHRVVTFETAGLPLWLARDVPDDAVVVYYRDQSGPSEVRHADSGARLGTMPAVGVRQWLSIMVPTDVGWLLFRDQLIEPNDLRFDVPDPAPPAPDDGRTVPEV